MGLVPLPASGCQPGELVSGGPLAEQMDRQKRNIKHKIRSYNPGAKKVSELLKGCGELGFV